jgi:hypothetical protein
MEVVGLSSCRVVGLSSYPAVELSKDRVQLLEKQDNSCLPWMVTITAEKVRVGPKEYGIKDPKGNRVKLQIRSSEGAAKLGLKPEEPLGILFEISVPLE